MHVDWVAQRQLIGDYACQVRALSPASMCAKVKQKS